MKDRAVFYMSIRMVVLSCHVLGIECNKFSIAKWFVYSSLAQPSPSVRATRQSGSHKAQCNPINLLQLSTVYLHISFINLPPYSITVSPPFATHPLPPSLLMPELLPSLPSNSVIIQSKLLHSCMPYHNPHFVFQLTPPPLAMLHCTLCSQYTTAWWITSHTIIWILAFAQYFPYPLGMVPGRYCTEFTLHFCIHYFFHIFLVDRLPRFP